ncbi:MAG TPA: GyrI-like domain-containing protein [Actinoplanes sp.]|jgi:effector-binding domain-containing protein|nr:GyrI-like domain-containing protein [Actinoplanes sp.]
MTEEQQVELEELAPQPALSIRATIPVAQLGDTMGERIRVLSQFLRERGTKPAGPPFVRYHTFGETETDMEFGVPVTEPTAGVGQVVSGELPGGPAVTTWHLGAHDRLGEAYGRIERWRTEHGREPAGPGWEVYHWIDLASGGDSSPADPSTWRVQLVQPIK